jgi:hypothetical protein
MQVTVVVASGAGGEFLFRCVKSLESQHPAAAAEIIVVDRVGDATRARLRREHPRVRVIPTDGGHRATIPEMRRLGAEAATSEIVAVLEEHCTVPPQWIAAIQGSFRPDDAAIGGPILDSAFDTRRDWCVYFSEYHNYLPPWVDGDHFALNGANIAYHREKLLKHRDVLDAGYWEVVLHPRLVQSGRFRAVNAMGAHHTGPFAYGYYLRQRYLLSRVWGGTQRALVSPTTRLLHVVLAPVFPAFLCARVSARVFAKRQYLGRYLQALPLLIPAWICYSFGESLGYLAGTGRALEEVE